MSRRTREQRRLDRLAAEKAAKGPWEYRALRWIVKAIVALMFTSYALLGASLTWTWLLTKWVRSQPVEKVVEIAEKSLSHAGGDPEAVRSWIAMRPASDGETIIKLLDPYVGRMGGMSFIIYAQWLAEANKLEEAAFWRQYARYRIRYDSLRCGSYDANKVITNILDDFPQPAIKAYMQEHPEMLPKELVKVLEFDKDHLPINDPTEFCKALVAGEEYRDNVKIKMTPPAQWPPIHDELRAVTILEVLRMEKEAREAAGEEKAPEKQTPAPAPPAPKKKRKP